MSIYSFKNDYSSLAHPEVMKALVEVLGEQYEGYGLDRHSIDAVDLIKKRLERDDVDVHFVSGGTQANLVVLSSLLKPYEAVIACNSGHIASHEAGAIENTGHKICTIDTFDGKLHVDDIEGILTKHIDEHMVKPKVVFISQSTELGTIYSKEELEEIYTFCKENCLYLYIDGARFAVAVNSRDASLSYSYIEFM